MAEQYYSIPENPQYDIQTIRKLQNSDPVNAQTIVNPLIARILENIAAVHNASVRVVSSATPPAKGPALWFCTDPSWRPEPECVALAMLGDPADAAEADVTGELNSVLYPVLNATLSEEGGNLVATLEQG